MKYAEYVFRHVFPEMLKKVLGNKLVQAILGLIASAVIIIILFNVAVFAVDFLSYLCQSLLNSPMISSNTSGTWPNNLFELIFNSPILTALFCGVNVYILLRIFGGRSYRRMFSAL